MAAPIEPQANLPPLTRLSEPQFEPGAAAIYAAALDALDRSDVSYLLGGALALNAHSGVWRDTKDVDVFVKPAQAQRALDVLAKEGFETAIVYESWLGKAWKGDVYVDVIWRGANALFPVAPSWFDAPASVRVFGRDVPVLPIEELLLSKMMVMSRHRFDGADMVHLLFATADHIDWRRLADLCGEHVGVMLAHLHLFRWAYPQWKDKVPDEIVRDFTERAAASVSSLGPFRGRLADIQSFEVDVQEWGMPDPHRLALERVFGSAEGRS